MMLKTRMHSSRMRTARSLAYWGSLSRAVSVKRGVSVEGGLCRGGSLSRGGTCQGDPPWTERRLQKYYLAPNFVCGR